MSSVELKIQTLESRLPGKATPEDQEDPRWQGIIELAEYVETEPEALWHFCLRWGSDEDPDLGDAVATCLLEHLLEHHFDMVFPRIEIAVQQSRAFADCFLRTWPFGETELPGNRERFERLKASVAASAS